MTILADSKLKRNKLVSCFLESSLLPTDHKIDLLLEELPVWKVRSSKFKRYLFEREQVWIYCDPLTVGLQCTNVENRSVSVFTILHSVSLGRTTEYVTPLFFQS